MLSITENVKALEDISSYYKENKNVEIIKPDTTFIKTTSWDALMTYNSESKVTYGIEVSKETNVLKNKMDGAIREDEAKVELEEKYPKEEGYEVLTQQYLRDKDGQMVHDPKTGEKRRIDFIVIKDGKVINSYEVTSKTAYKTAQEAKEARIREAGGNYIQYSKGTIIEIPADVKTQTMRMEVYFK